MTKRTKEERENLLLFKWVIGFFVLFFSLLVFLAFVFFLWRPFNGVITEGRPMLEKLCEMQGNCHVGYTEEYPCSYKGILNKEHHNTLKHWEKYNGCNNSTESFFERNDAGYVGGFEYCSCGGFQ